MNTNKKIARSFVHGNKTQTRLLYSGLCSLFIFAVIFLIFQDSFLQYRQEENFKKYGAWSGAVYGGNEKIHTFLKEQKSVKQLGTICVFENFSISVNDFSAYAATIDSEAFELAKIDMIKGSLPQKNNEIVLDQHLLKQIAPAAKPGDHIEIPLLWSDDKKPRTCSFILSGIMNTWGKHWARDYHPLPSAFVNGKHHFPKDVLEVKHYFYLADKKGSYAVPGLDSLLKQTKDCTCIFNERVYSPALSADSNFFEKGTFIAFLCTTGILVVFFLLSMIITRIRYRIIVMRNIGADFLTICRIFMWEAFFIWRKGILLGVGSGLVLSYIMIFMIKHGLHWNIPFVINWFFLAVVLLALSLTFWAGYFIIILSSSIQRLPASYREDNNSISRKHFPKLKTLKRMNVFRFCIRTFVFYPKQLFLKTGISVLSVFVLSLNTVNFLEHYYHYRNIDVDYKYSLTIFDIEKSLNLKQIEKLNEIPGILSIHAQKMFLPKTGSISVSWDGWEDNDYINVLRKNSYAGDAAHKALKKSDGYDISQLTGLDASDMELVTWYADSITDGHLDYEKFFNGEQCILFLPPFFLEETDMMDKEYSVTTLLDPADCKKVSEIYEYKTDRSSIQPGDKLTLDIDGKKYELEVGGIVTEITGMAPDNITSVVASGEIAVSEKFITNIANISESEYNVFEMVSSVNADHAETDWQIANLLTNFTGDTPENDSYILNNYRENARLVADMAITGMLKSVFLIIMVLLLSGFILYKGTIGKIQNEEKKLKTLHFLGMTKKKIKRIYWLETIFTGIGSGLFGIIVAGIVQFKIWQKDSGYTIFHAVFEAAIRKNPINAYILLIYGLILLLHFFIYLFLVIIPLKKFFKTSFRRT